MGPTWGPPGSCRSQMGPMLAPWTLLSWLSDPIGAALKCKSRCQCCFNLEEKSHFTNDDFDFPIFGGLDCFSKNIIYHLYHCGDKSLQWRHNGLDSISNHHPHDCLLNRLFRRRSKKTSKLRVTGLCAGNSPGTGEFPAQMASIAENISIWWRHHVCWWNRPLFKRWDV